MGLLWLGESRIRGTPSDERSLRLASSGKEWWEQLHHFYVLVALIGTVAGFAAGATFKEKILLVFVGGYVVVIAVFAAWSVFVNGAKARYAPLMRHVHSAMHCMRNLRVAMNVEEFHKDPASANHLANELTQVLDSLRSCLEIVSGTTVEVRVEIVFRSVDAPVSSLQTIPLCRDSVSRQRRRHMDEDAMAKPHAADRSTPYIELLDHDGGDFYFNGDLASQQDYRSEYMRRFPNDSRPRSVVVWPIRFRRIAIVGNGPGKHEIVGFLHAESASRAAFNRRYDVELGASFADSLFDVIFSHLKHRPGVVHAILQA